MCQTRVSLLLPPCWAWWLYHLGTQTECREEISIDDCWEVAIVTSLQMVLGRFTCNMTGSLVDSASQTDCLGRGTCIGLKPPFRPSGYTTSMPHWRSLWTSKQLSYPQVLLLGAPSTMMLMYPVLERVCVGNPHTTAQRCRASCPLCWWVGWVSLLLLLARRGKFGRDGLTQSPARISFPPQLPELVLWGGRSYWAWASWGLPRPFVQEMSDRCDQVIAVV